METSIEPRTYGVSPQSDLQDPGLLLELLVFVRVGIRELIDSDALLSDLIQNLRRKHREETQTGKATVSRIDCS